jgi:hypothetical protein
MDSAISAEGSLYKDTNSPLLSLQLLDSGKGEGGGILSDNMLESLENHAISTEADFHISLYALSGVTPNKTIHLRALIGNQVVSILLDSCSSNTFLNSSMLSIIPTKQCQHHH